MRHHQLANFSDVSFIQSIDKPKYMRPLLRPWESYFLQRGLTIGTLENGDATDRKLHEVFTTAREDMPRVLLELLYVLDDFADENGRDRLLDEAQRRRLSLSDIVGKDLSAGEFTIALFLAHPALVTRCHSRLVNRKVKNYEEYQALGTKGLSLASAMAAMGQLQDEMGRWFESKDRTRACEVTVYDEKHDLKFQISHGRPFRLDPGLSERLEATRVPWRPRKYDSVIYDTKDHVLRINAQTLGEKDLYRQSFGKVLFGDSAYFPTTELYTLKPLSVPHPCLVPCPGVIDAQLVEVEIEVDDVYGFAQISKGYDLLEMN